MKVLLKIVCAVSLSLAACGKDGDEFDGGDGGRGGSGGDVVEASDLPLPAKTPLKGKIDNESWTFSAGRVAARGFAEDDDKWFHIDLYGAPMADDFMTGKPADLCDSAARATDGKQIVAKIPRRVGEFNLGQHGDEQSMEIYTATFVYPKEDGLPHNFITDKGRFVIEEITETKVVGRVILHGEFEDTKEGTSEYHHVDGHFEVERCGDS